MTTTPRVDVHSDAPAFAAALIRATAAAKEDLDPVVAELVLVRVSQLNRCAFCVDMHSTDALAVGVSEPRLRLLPAWEEAGDWYDARERAALALAESATVGSGTVPDAVFEEAAHHFDTREIAGLTGLIAVINAWNRVNAVAAAVPARSGPADA